MQEATAAPAASNGAGGEQKKLWGGRFTGATDPLMEKFNESLPFDKRMWREDLRVRQWTSLHAACGVACSPAPAPCGMV